MAWNVLLALVAGTVFAQAPSGRVGAPAGSTMRYGGADEPLAVWLAHTESSNVLRGASAARGSYDSVGAMFNLARERERLQTALFGELEFRKYADDVAEEEGIGTVGAYANAVLVPDRFTWSFEESYGQGRTDPFGADTPLNREAINVFVTRPELDVPLGDRTALSVAGTFSDRQYEETIALDSVTVGYELGLHRYVGRTTTFGLVAETSDIDYDATSTDYQIESLRLTYARVLASGTASAAIGTNRLELGPSETTGPLVELAWSRALTARSTLTVSADRQFTDAGRLYSFNPRSIGVQPTDVLLTSEPTDRREAGVAYSLVLVRTDFVLQAAAFEDEFESDTLDSDGLEIGFEIRRELTRSMAAGLGLDKQRRDFTSIDTEYDDLRIRLWFSRELGPPLDLEVLAQRTEREGINSFDSSEYRVSLVFVPGRRR